MSPIHALLGLLAQGERHGYALKRVIDDEFAPFWRIDFAQLYRSLAKMTRVGWVKARIQPGAAGPNRQMYTLTARGRKELDGWLAESPQDRAEFFVKLRLAAALDAPVAPMLAAQRRALEEERAARAESHAAARATRDSGRLALADAALRETDAALAALELSAARMPRTRGIAGDAPPCSLVIVGSDDPLLARLAQIVHASTRAVGSLAGLLALAQHHADIAGAHLRDAETGEYNVPFVKHLLPEQEFVLVNLAVRETGLMLARGNPKNIRALRDLTRRDVRLINRQRGAGTRLWLYSKLRAARIDPRALRDWERAVSTHDAIADTLALGAADAGPGLRAIAVTRGLDFIPLGEERYDLVIPRAEYAARRMQPVLAALHSAELRHIAAAFAGYDLARAGKVIARVK